MSGRANWSFISLASILVVQSSAAYGVEPLEHELVRSDPAARAIIGRLRQLDSTAAIEVIGKQRQTNPVTGHEYTVLKVRFGREDLTCMMNESTGTFATDPRLPGREAQEVLNALPPVYRKMGPHLLETVRRAQGGRLGTEVTMDTVLDVTFYTDSTDGLDAIQAAIGNVPVERFDAPALYAEKPPTVRPDKDGVVTPAPPPPPVRTISAKLPIDEVLRVGALPATTHIEPTTVMTARLDVSVPRINGDDLKSFGLDGWDADIGIVDTGIDDTHPHLPYVIAGADFTGETLCLGGADGGMICRCRPPGACIANVCDGGLDDLQPCVLACAAPGLCERSEDDRSGHGTHVAGIAGNDSAAFEGMAPFADLINAKAIPGNSARIEAALVYARGQGADLINGSYGTTTTCTAPAGVGICAAPPGCTAPFGNVGNPCMFDSDCDSPPPPGNGVCGAMLNPCLASADCDSAPGAGDGFCAAVPADRSIPCIVNADCDVPPGAGNGICSAPRSNGQSADSRSVDFEVFDHNITVAIAAEERPYNGRCSNNPATPCGNNAPCAPGGGTCVAFPSSPNDAFNVITVGSSDLNLAEPPSLVTTWSQVGPTSDGRSKPDVIAPGEGAGDDGIDSTAHDWEGANPDFADMEGTSMAAPHVTGLAALLWDWGSNHGILTDTPYIKATIMNTCNRLAGWVQPSIFQPLDTSQGTGEIDALQAFRAYADDLRVWQQRVTGTDPEDSHWYWIDVTGSGDPDTRVVGTLVFERHVTKPAVAAPALNDLDLYLYDPNSSPVGRSLSLVDSVEHIVFDPPRDGRYCFEVDPFDLSQDGAELYALAAGQPPEGNVRDFRLNFLGTTNPCRPDFGDAPDPWYPTLLASDGARHLDWTKEWLGTSREEIDGELEKVTLAVHSRVDPFPSVSGEVDATDPLGLDEDGVPNLVDKDKYDDGVVLPTRWLPLVPHGVSVTVQTTVNKTGVGTDGRYDSTVPGKRLYLNAWADWNGDGKWAADEKIIGTDSPTGQVAIDPETFGPNGDFTIGEAFTDANGSGRWEPGEAYTDTVGATEATFDYLVTPPAVVAPSFYLRFRLDYGENVGKVANVSGNLAQEVGAAQFGEVEDYASRLLDHFLCYKTKRRQKFNLTLEDQFDSATFFLMGRSGAKRFCTPAGKSGEEIFDQETHLAGYRIKGLHQKRTNIEVVNQFGSFFYDTRGPHIMDQLLLVPSLKSLPPAPSPGLPDPGSLVDHYRCFKVRRTAGTKKFPRGTTVVVEDQFGTRTAVIKKASRLCLPADKNGEGIKNPEAHLMCYKIKPDPGHSQVGVQINNQLGAQLIDLRREVELCVPSVKIATTTTTTTTTSSTTTTTLP